MLLNISPEEYPAPRRGKVVVWGLLASYPFGGMTWQVLHHLVGLRRLGFDVWYVEDSDAEVRDPVTLWPSSDCTPNIEYLAKCMRAIGLEERWIFRPPGVYDSCHGAADNPDGLARLYQETDAALNLCGSHRLRPEHGVIPCLIYLETDPVPVQVAVANGNKELIAYLENYDYLFTYAENIGASDCLLPVERFEWRPTRPPVCVDWWFGLDMPPENASLTTIANWKHTGNDVVWKGVKWRWSKHHEFLKFINLPSRSRLPLELALGAVDADQTTNLLDHGWNLRTSTSLSDPGDYRDYIRGSLGEFTAAKEQYVLPRTGWFSDRSVCYLAAGRPVVTQDTGFGNVLPTGEGLFAFSTEEDALAAIEGIAQNYERHATAAHAVAREYFAAERVLADVMRVAGLL